MQSQSSHQHILLITKKNNVALLILTTKTAIQNGLLAYILACLQCD